MLMAGQSPYQPGWQAVHAFRKTFGRVPAEQAGGRLDEGPAAGARRLRYAANRPGCGRRQPSFSAPKAEGLSGYLDGRPMGNLAVLDCPAARASARSSP